jgi:predicted kinase
MRYLFVLQGAPGAGKSTWIQENSLEPYTICPDTIRLLFSSPVLINGRLSINQNHDKKVWSTVYDILTYRMQHEETTILDATCSSNMSIQKYYNLCQKYFYHMYVVRFNISLEECLNRNKQREEYKQVPEDIVKQMYSNIINTIIPFGVTILTPEEAKDEVLSDSKILGGITS